MPFHQRPNLSTNYGLSRFLGGGDRWREDSKPYTITVPPSQELQKITAGGEEQRATSKDLCDENGTLKGENLLKAKDRIKVKPKNWRQRMPWAPRASMTR